MAPLKFSELNLIDQVQKSIKAANYETPTPIQEQTIPLALKGHDVLGIAQTGTGKTAAFCLPIINNLYQKNERRTAKCPKSLILTPTRELAIQIHQSLETYGSNTQQKYAVVFGGVGQGRQVKALSSGVDILVATPGRLLDLVGQGHIRLDSVGIFVLDEADRMLDMGFMKAIQEVLRLLPQKRHNLFFSATMPNEIQKLANKILENPKKVEVTPQATTVEKIDQTVMYVEKADKLNLLIHLLKELHDIKVLVFVEMKYAANRIAKKLEDNGIPTAVIHGNKSQTARQNAIKDFTNDKLKVMIATDIASRGIDIDGITHVINYQLSNIAESYVHRIGRTARAGAEGKAISLVTGDEKSFLVHIEKTIDHRVKVIKEHPYHSDTAQNAEVSKVGKAKAKIERERKQELNAAYREKNKNKPKTAANNRPRRQRKKSSTRSQDTSR